MVLGRGVPEPRDYGGVEPAASALLVETSRAAGSDKKGAAEIVVALLDGLTIADPGRRRELERHRHELASR